MIKGIIGYKVGNYKDIEGMLMKLRSHAMQYPGFVSAENLVSDADSTVVIMISTWQNTDNWRAWLKSRITQDLIRPDKELAKDQPRTTVYRVMPTAEWR
jgi:antibiotic biosynthesis monooxygenase (ABM) superfamily enzyme